MRLFAPLVAAVVFGVLVILNSGGYRYGISDQAFYIPAILQHLDPDLYPRDRLLLAAQDRFMVSDEAFALLSRSTGASLPVLFLVGYLVGVLLLAVALARMGRLLYRSWWSVAALGLALTLRHRIAKTGVNTLEGYFHPRVLAFAVGALAIVQFLRGRSWSAVALGLLAALVHPTTGLWVSIWIGAAIVATDAKTRPAILGGAVAAVAGAVWMVWLGPLRGGLAPMDPAWRSALAEKDYLFPNAWPLSAWIVNGSYPIVILALHRYRRRTGVALPRETGLVAGAMVLLAMFLASVPPVASGVALLVQLQVSRIFWMLDLLATSYLVWLVVEAPPPVVLRRARPRCTADSPVRRAAVAALAIVAIARGGYVFFVERPERPVLQTTLPDDDWHDVMRWAHRTPVDTHLLAHPGHAWRYGTSVRVAAQRDVYLEAVKDAAIATYSRPVAVRVSARVRDLGDFEQLTPATAIGLAARYDLDYLISERALDLPVAYRNARFFVYNLGGGLP